MTIWRTIPVDMQPTLTLENWRVFDTQADGWHFVGYCIENQEGRVSSAVHEFDPVTARGVTRTSRVYQLSGAPGIDADSLYVWNQWARMNNENTAHDVTNEVWAAIQEALRKAPATERAN